MQALFLRVVILSLTCSAVLLPLLLLSRHIRHRYAAKSCYFLWLLLAIRLLLPMQIALPQPAVVVEAPTARITVQQGGIIPAQNGPVIPSDTEASVGETTAKTIPVMWILCAVWLAGIALILSVQGVSYLLSRRALLRRARPADGETLRMAVQLKDELGLRRAVPVRYVRSLHSPMMLGLFRPVIVLPGRVMEAEALSLVLRHELVHLRRGDVAYKVFLLLVNAVHWFNPLVWLMSREAGRNLELCCDDEVVQNADEHLRRYYGEILLNTAAAGRAPALSTHFGSGKTQLKGRINNLFRQKKNSAAMVCVILACALLAGSLVACKSTAPPLTEGENPTQSGTVDPVETDPDASAIYYVNSEYGFAIRFPEEWAGQLTVTEEDDKRLMTVYQSAGRSETDPGAGFLMNLCVVTQEEFDGLYGDKNLDGIYENGGPRLTVLGQLGGNRLVYAQIDPLPEDTAALAADYVRMHEQGAALTPDAFSIVGLKTDAGETLHYTSSVYGFTLDFPQDWLGQFRVEEYQGLPTVFMEDAGEFEGRLLSIEQTDSDTWRTLWNEGADAPFRVAFVAEEDGTVFYAQFASDVQYDPAKDEARYQSMAEVLDRILETYQAAP